MYTSDQIVHSIDRHFLIGCPGITASQVREHKTRLLCRECDQRTRALLLDAAPKEAVRD
jgi:hypothetical protein